MRIKAKTLLFAVVVLRASWTVAAQEPALPSPRQHGAAAKPVPAKGKGGSKGGPSSFALPRAAIQTNYELGMRTLAQSRNQLVQAGRRDRSADLRERRGGFRFAAAWQYLTARSVNNPRSEFFPW